MQDWHIPVWKAKAGYTNNKTYIINDYKNIYILHSTACKKDKRIFWKKMHDVVLWSRMTRVKLKQQDRKITNNSWERH